MRRSLTESGLDETEPRRLLNMREAAVWLGIAVPTLYAWCSARKIPYVKISKRINMFEITSLEQFIAARRVQAVNTQS
jgi:predicted DNA-binding transcriptional regulator AlpA